MLETQEMRVRSLVWEDPLEEGIATHSSILARTIPWTEESVGLESIGSQRVRHDWSDWAHTGGISGKEPSCRCRRHIRDVGFITGLADSLEKGMAVHTSTLAWRISWREDPAGLQSIELQRIKHDWRALECTRMHTHVHTQCVHVYSF